MAKPDPRAFAPAISALGLHRRRLPSWGDGGRYDVLTAENAALPPVHFTYGTCTRRTSTDI